MTEQANNSKSLLSDTKKHWQPSLSLTPHQSTHSISTYFIKLVHFTLLIIRQLNLDPSNLLNYRPVSCLLSLSETLERAANSAKFLSRLSALDPLILLLCHSLDGNSFPVTRRLNAASPPRFNAPSRLTVLYGGDLELQPFVHIWSFDKSFITRITPEHYEILCRAYHLLPLKHFYISGLRSVKS